jgi:ABC-type branched-subunit amino acid transport system substrate-binding protein
MVKKLLMVVAVLALLIPVVGCGPAPAETIKIGCVLSTTGLLGPMGEKMMQGAELAVQEINAQGGVLGKQIELLEEDDNTDSATCLERVKKLVEVDGVKVLVGGMTSGATMASGSYLADHEILMVSPSATNPGIADQVWKNWVFRTCLSDALQGEALAPIIEEGNYTRLATIVQDNPYGVGLEGALLSALNETGWQGEHVISIHFDPAKLDYLTELGQIADANPDIVLAVTYCDDGKVLFKQALDMGLDNIAWLGCDGNYGSGMFEEPKCAEFMEKAIIAGTRTAGASGAAYDEFVAAYNATFGATPEVYCDTTYDAIKLIAQAIEQAGTYNSTAIKDALMEIGQNYEGASGPISFNTVGDRISGTFEVWKVEKDAEGVYHDVTVKYVTL